MVGRAVLLASTIMLCGYFEAHGDPVVSPQSNRDTPDSTGHVAVGVKNLLGFKLMRGVWAFITDSAGRTDSTLSGDDGVAVFRRVRTGPVIVWVERGVRRDTVWVRASMTTHDTLESKPRDWPARFYK